MNLAKYESSVLKKLQGLGLMSISSYLTFDPSNNYVYVPMNAQLAYVCEDIIKGEGFKIRRMIKNDIQAGCHVSVVLPEEQKHLKSKNLKDTELKWAGKGIVMNITGLTTTRREICPCRP